MRITDRNENPFDSYRRTSMLAPQRETAEPTRTFADPGSGIGQGFGDTLPEAKQDPMRGYDDEIMGLMKPSPGLLAYKEYLNTTPKREDYAPSGWTRAAAGLSGLSAGMRDAGQGIKVAQGINESGYRNALQDFATRGSGLKETADIEQDDRANQVKVLQQARAMGLDYDKLQFERDKFGKTNSLAQEKNDIDRMRAEAYVADKQRKGYDTINLANGSVMFTNKNDPSDRYTMTPAEMGGGTVAGAQLGISGMNAQTSRMQAITGQNAQQEGAYQNYWTRNRPAEAPRPDDTTKSYDFAMERLSQDPTFAEFFKDDGKGNLILDPLKMKSPRYRVFQRALEDTAKAVNDGIIFDPPAGPAYGAPPPKSLFGGGFKVGGGS